ncbi:hypothetical protein VKT23_016523 [Stygiomarasmius scandens]|uniref:Mannan endo-1,4-beta-mannosidase n=1 Tax=Marasmiellus scandens TaxID=2682957 RepID=A0ABR1IWS4_9AGAR
MTQNEPENSNPTYPSCSMSPEVEGQLGASLRSLMNQNGLGSVKIIGYEHNWEDAGSYPVTLLNDNPNAFAGVSFHCYKGDVTNQDAFHSAYPNKEIYFTECVGTVGSDWWKDIKWYMTNLYVYFTYYQLWHTWYLTHDLTKYQLDRQSQTQF